VFRAVEKYAPTLLIDEADTFLTGRNPNDELRGILNSGHNRAAARVIRCVGDEHEPRMFKTWAPKAIALIGQLPPTLEDRAVLVQLRRRAPGDKLEPLRIDRLDKLEHLCRKAARWTADNLDALREADPAVPSGLHDRAADNWRPLLAIADAAGGDWPEEARKAASLLGGAADDGDAAGPMLLADLRELFEERAADRLPSAAMVAALVELEHRPWPEWKRGNPMTPTALGRLLKPYGVTSKQWRDGDERHRGYVRADLEDAFARYTPLLSRDSRDNPTAATVSRTFATRDKVNGVTGSESADNRTPTLSVTAGTAQKGKEAISDPEPEPSLRTGALRL
jgi:putative DNA primase/helicase